MSLRPDPPPGARRVPHRFVYGIPGLVALLVGIYVASETSYAALGIVVAVVGGWFVTMAAAAGVVEAHKQGRL